MVGPNKISLLRLRMDEDVMYLDSESQSGRVNEQVAINKSGEGFETAFNSKYLEEILRSIDEERLVMESRSADSPSMFKPVDSDKFLYLLMPVKGQGGS
jgi:DNA polymerase-3 subunit beta